ncbi:MAG: hypothetical protein A2Y41_04160 [Spirochaetes bacterium GWB1_36_13]|nr:MAG: hypothetical protein A2Y41_04160 [Spirochaetes bacterium GWB1_36_13]
MKIERRFNILKGQIDGIRKMIDEKKDCIEIVQQFKAVKSGLNQLSREYLNDYIENCLVEQKIDADKLNQLLKIMLNS